MKVISIKENKTTFEKIVVLENKRAFSTSLLFNTLKVGDEVKINVNTFGPLIQKV